MSFIHSISLLLESYMMIQILGSNFMSCLVGMNAEPIYYEGRTTKIIVLIISYRIHSNLSQMVGPVEWKVSRPDPDKALFRVEN